MQSPSELRCEYAINPMGVQTAPPRLSWILHAEARGQHQTACQILVAGSPDALAAGNADLWDSGKLETSESVGIEYAGPPLASRRRCWWKVRVWDRDGVPSEYSEAAYWEMGLLRPDDWQAEWLGCPANWPGRALYFRNAFTLDKPVESARAYVAGLGYYELRVNGDKVGDHVLDPACSDYSKRVYYVPYDITEYLTAGENVAEAIVGHGWYGVPKLLLQMEIIFTDGSTKKICTGRQNEWAANWTVAPGPILADSIYGGETYDARLEIPGWDRPGGKIPPLTERTERRISAMPIEPPGGTLVAQPLEPIRIVETRRPQSVAEPQPGIFVFDTGQNLAGWARLHVQGERDRTVTLRYAEVLSENGTVNQENLRTAGATDHYILKGEGSESWEPRFTYHGFRYVQVEGFPGTPDLETLEICVVRSSVESAGRFECSNELLNAIAGNIWWTEASNLHGIPTDCPQRDERMGWLNDMTVRAETALYQFDLCRLYAKWLDDIQDAQCPRTGAITDTAPFKWGNRPADPVDASYLIVPWLLYVHYGDRRTLAEHYDGLKQWVDFLGSRAQDHIVSYSHWGDWAPPAEQSASGSIGGSAISRNTPGALMSTGFYYYSARLLAQMAEVLGKAEEQRVYTERAEKIAAAYDRRFWNEEIGGYGSNNQACNAFSLYLGLVEPERVARVLDNLVKDVLERHDGHLTTGNLCTKYLLEVLSEYGQEAIAYRLAAQETYPSWGYMVRHGATTLWERWEYLTGGAMNSHNHPMLGSVGVWFYKVVTGIAPDPAGPAWASFTIRPHVVGDLTHATARVKTVRGIVHSAWMKTEEQFTLRIVVPVNSKARVRLPRLYGTTPCEVREGETLLWRAGLPVEAVTGVTEGREDRDSITFTVGSGFYQFRMRPVREP